MRPGRAEAGAPLKKVSAILGHAGLSITSDISISARVLLARTCRSLGTRASTLSAPEDPRSAINCPSSAVAHLLASPPTCTDIVGLGRFELPTS